MKRIYAITLTMVSILGILSGCAKPNAPQGDISVVCTIFPQYDWTRQILGDKLENADVTLLLDSGADLHSYQPTVDDILAIAASDLFIYVGGESDAWVEDALRETANPDRIVINLLEALGSRAKLEEIVAGMEDDEHDHDAAHEEESDHDVAHEEEHGHEEESDHDAAHEEEHDVAHEEEHDHGEEHEDVYDEHVWLSLKNAPILLAAIENALSTLDSANAETYRNNLASYNEALAALDGEYQTITAAAPVKTLLFGDRFPFRYLTDDYGLTYYAAFPGCSAETEASFATIAFLADKVDELNLHNVMTLEGSDQSIARTIIDNTIRKNGRILLLDSMQSLNSQDIQNGANYLAVMEGNLRTLEDALR